LVPIRGLCLVPSVSRNRLGSDTEKTSFENTDSGAEEVLCGHVNGSRVRISPILTRSKYQCSKMMIVDASGVQAEQSKALGNFDIGFW